ncbi:nucleoredoxin-like protein 2 isoform X1 [Pan paniscus]|uniref:nucleoredoxin-like protein 2 isoform X1 n=1 Tax=Pan paniscus TaxID=9597 RepID=UPI001560BF21|nr:nucleoredoxin-like protein 2 isoform X1 [Pan paniscus]
MVDILGGRHLVTCKGATVEAEAALQNKVVALYFAAARCAPSRDFTPLLCDFYTALVAEARRPALFEVVFVSADGSSQEMLDFMRELHGAWLALPFHDPYRQTLVFPSDWLLVQRPIRFSHALLQLSGGFLSFHCPQDRARHGSVPGIPRECVCELRKRYNVTAIPKLVIVKQNGEVITNKGRKQIRERGLACFQDWVEAADIFQNFSV